MNLTSTAFQQESNIPKQYTGEGKDISPPLAWSGPPAGAKSFALICDDPDAPRKEPWVHWVIYNLPAEKKELTESVSGSSGIPGVAKEGRNDFGKIGYGGPMSPPGKPHRYYFKLYALDAMLDLKEGATKQQLEAAMKGHILAEGQLMGKYAR
jgi:Raf kinase inhibitor-like YbhB/YbcL family protein